MDHTTAARTDRVSGAQYEPRFLRPFCTIAIVLIVLGILVGQSFVFGLSVYRDTAWAEATGTMIKLVPDGDFFHMVFLFETPDGTSHRFSNKKYVAASQRSAPPEICATFFSLFLLNL